MNHLIDSDESELSDGVISDSDDELLFVLLRDCPKNENYLRDTVPSLNDREFFEHFRVNRNLAQMLAERYANSPLYQRASGLGAEHRILVFLWYCGHQTSSFRDVADRFDITISSLEDIIKKLSVFISDISPEVIKWPTDEEKIISEQAFAQRGFPGTIGALDGTHIKIDKPGEDPESYYNRKDFYSVQVQAVCDHRNKIIDIFVGLPGSVHDARSFRMSSLAETLEQKCGRFFIVADSAYPCLLNLITHYRDRGTLTARQKRFNTHLSKARIIIEHSFGIAKQKFRQLYHLKLRNMEIIIHFIRACFVLHNLALDDLLPVEEPTAQDPPSSTVFHGLEEEDSSSGVQRRDQICATFQ